MKTVKRVDLVFPDAMAFIRLSSLAIVLTLIPFMISVYFNSTLLMIAFLVVYTFFVSFAIKAKAPRVKEVMCKFFLPINVLFGLFIGHGMVYMDFNKGVLAAIANKNMYLFILFVVFTVQYILLNKILVKNKSILTK